MARIWQTGFEMGSTSIFNVRQAGNIQTSPTRGSWSTYSMQGIDGSTFSLPTTVTEFYFGVGFYTNAGNQSADIARFTSPNSVDNLRLAMDGNGHLRVLRNTTTLATGTTILSTSTWYFIEFYGLIHTSTGKYQVKINGADEIALATGQNTQADGGTGGNTCDRIMLVPSTAYWIDEVYLNDTTGSQNTGFSGDIRISGYIPNAAGDTTGLTRGGTDSGTNYGQIDERPPNDVTDYVYGTDTTSYDLYNIPNTSGIATIQAVTLWLRSQKSDAGAANIAHMLKSGGTENTGSDLSLSTSWQYLAKTYNNDPTDSTAWTTSKIDSLQIGVKSR